MARKLCLLAFIGALVAALIAPVSAGMRKSTVHEVVMTGGPAVLFAYTPDELTISKGERVAWSNATGAVHHVTFYDGPSDESLHVPAGGAEVERFRKRGAYLYRCDINTHSYMVGDECVGMCGKLIVE